jgi:hypothetical protein
MIRAVTREQIVREALTWVGCPFHDCSGVKGAGVDCVHLLIRVAAAVGLIEDFEPEAYSPQWFEHHDEPRFLFGMERYCHRVDVPGPGDFEMFNFGRHAAHSAILIDEYSMVHAYKPAGRVILDSRRALKHRHDSYWSAFP